MRYPVLDLGNAQWKGVNGGLVGSGSQYSTPNVMVELQASDYAHLAYGDTPSSDVAKIAFYGTSKKPIFERCYAFNGLAIRLGGVPRYGLNRYMPEYIGVACAYMLSNLYQTDGECCVVALNAPSVRDAGAKIEASYLGTWVIEHASKTKRFAISQIRRMEEVTGGLWLRLVDKERTRFVPQTGQAMVIDIGGGTTEFLLTENGKPLFDTVRSVKVGQRDIGVNQIMTTFADALRRNPIVMSAYADGFELDDALVQRAFRDKHLYIAYQQKSLDVATEFDLATSGFITSLATLYQQAGGLRVDNVYTTGGGGYVLLNHLRPPLRRANDTMDFIAPELADYPQFANARGAQRFIGLLRNLGKLKDVDND